MYVTFTNYKTDRIFIKYIMCCKYSIVYYFKYIIIPNTILGYHNIGKLLETFYFIFIYNIYITYLNGLCKKG